MDWLPWLPLAAVSLHICEEFVFPGGFPEWYRRYRPNVSRITTRFLVLINGALVAMCVVAGAMRNSLGIFYWLLVSAIVAANGCWHLWASYRSRAYSPGMVTGLLIYVPLFLVGYDRLVRPGTVPVRLAMCAYLIGGTYQFWSATYHRVRPKRQA